MGLRGRSTFEDAAVFFITTTTVSFTKVFSNTQYCDLLIHNIKHYQEKYNYIIFGYVIMPSHLHWMIAIDRSRGLVTDIMRDLKKYSAWDIMEAIEKDGRDDMKRIFKLSALQFPKQKRKFWMPRFYDEVIRNDEMLRVKLNYIHMNPVKAGLVERQEDYLYSSARNYILEDDSILHVETGWIV